MDKTQARPSFPAGIYLFNVYKGNIRTMFEICLKLTITTPEQRNWRHRLFLIDKECSEALRHANTTMTKQELNCVT